MVDGSVVRVVPEEVMASGYAAGSRAGEVGGVRQRAEDHLRSAKYFSSVGVGGGVAE
jgi:hypothetical protein